MKRYDVLIVGDFPPATHTGISMVNALVRDILIEQGRAVHIIDESAWVYKGIKRAIHYLLGSHFSLLKFLLSSRTKYVYLNIPLSVAGQLRLLISCIIVKVFSPSSNLIGHIHRGDISVLAQKSINRCVFKLILAFFSSVVVLSKKFEVDLKSISPRTNSLVIPNTSLLEGLTRKPDVATRNDFVCVSNIIETKGLADLVEAFSDYRLKDYRLKIVGNIYDKLFYDNLIRNKSSNVEFITDSDREKVNALILSSQCLILPSWNEGQPLVILEAMSVGLPIIATNVGDIENMLGTDYQFLFEPHNVNMLINKVLEFISFEGKDEISLKIRENYLKNYSRAIFTNNIHKLFK